LESQPHSNRYPAREDCRSLAFYAAEVFAHANLRPDECIIVGDRLYTDIAMGHAAGMDSALVFTGETTPKMLEEADLEAHPTYTLNNVREVFPP